jgi:predicted HD phosphohydrolase
MELFEEAINRFPKEVVSALKKTEQDPKHHPEGNVYEHIKLVYRAAQLRNETPEMLAAALFHDLGKIACTRKQDGKITSYGHESFAKHYIESYKHLFPEVAVWEEVDFICENHMRMHQFDSMRPAKQQVLMAHPYFEALQRFSKYDSEGKHEN